MKTFEEGEVYGVDILIASTEDGKARSEEARTTIYKKSDIVYQLKMKTSRTVFAEIKQKVSSCDVGCWVMRGGLDGR